MPLIMKCVILIAVLSTVCATSTNLNHVNNNNILSKNPIIHLKTGLIRGTSVVSDDGTRIYSYRGIPYAEPPIGDLRFRSPQKKLPWKGIWDATKEITQCKQYDEITYDIIGDEDCLYLNVFTPKYWLNTSTLPVMVFIHGGTFLFGSAKRYGPQRLLGHRIVLVVINYRLGPLGFLSTEDAASVGNYGLKDQNLALRWIQENIRMFGGDPSRVIIVGQSAGAISAMMHMTSPLGKGLFHSIIAQSGPITCEWSMTLNPKKWAIIMGELLHCPLTNSFLMVECLRNASVVDVMQALVAVDKMWDFMERAKFHPTLENHSPITSETYLPEYPWIQMQKGNFIKVPLILGVNKDEGYLAYNYISRKYNAFGSKHLQILQESIMRYLPDFRHVPSGVLYNAIWNEYFAGRNMSEDEIEKTVIQVYGDASYTRVADTTVDLVTSLGIPTYVYKFTYVNPKDGNGLVNHGSELEYLFRLNEGQQFTNTFEDYGDEKLISDYFVSMWTNFAKTSEPTPKRHGSEFSAGMVKWLPTHSQQYKFLNITVTPSMMLGYLNVKAEFWRHGIYRAIEDYNNSCL